MGKFSDLPKFLLNDYFEGTLSTSDTTNTTIKNSYLFGGRSSTIVDGGYWTKMWIKIDKIGANVAPYPGFTEYKFRIDDSIRDNDNFNFELGALLTLPASANGTFDTGSEVYFKKGSYIYEWLVKNSPVYKEYFNTNKMWLYFGKIYLISGDTTKYRIVFDGMKNFVMNALPEHQRTDNLDEFMDIYFDKIYSKIYNMSKNAFSLLDAKEIDINWIEYLAKNYDIELDRYFSGISLREWVENIVYLLKRKGTYSSLFIIWKTLLKNTLNNLNIYDRWHVDLTGITDVPLEHFLDILHQMEYGRDPVGCSGSYWYQKYFILADSVLHTQTNASYVWDIYHQMFAKNVIAQCYNTSGERIWPISIVAINAGLLRITFNQSIAGYAFLIRRGDYVHTQEILTVGWNMVHKWNIAHMLNQLEVLNQYQTTNWSTMLPKSVNLVNANVLNAEFGTAVKGFGLIKSLGVYAFAQGAADTTWTINHGLGSQYVFVQAYDTNNDMLQPHSITLTATDGGAGVGTVILTFNEAVDGFIVVKVSEDTETLPGYGITDMLLSTHYRVEVDLSCEPLDDEEEPPSILTETTIDRLTTNWELMRPVSRFSHYHELISPITDFSSNDISLYGHGYNASLHTKYVVSAGELLPVPDSDTMIYYQYVNSNTWTVSHTLSATDWIVQCYDDSDYRIWPKIIHPLGVNDMEIIFEDAVNGHAVFAEVTPPSGVAYSQPIDEIEWDVVHEMGVKEAIIQWDDFTNTKMMPSGAILEGVNDIRIIWGEPKRGYNLLSSYDIVYPKPLPAQEWVINHNLGMDTLIAQFFDDNDNMMEPMSLYLNSRNKATAIFATEVSGYVVIRGVNKSITEQEVINSIVGGTWVIGQGASGSSYDPLITNNVRTLLASGGSLDVDDDDDYYYIDFEVNHVISNGVDWDITEILILNREGDPKFYSYFSPIHKPADVWFNAHLRIKRGQT